MGLLEAASLRMRAYTWRVHIHTIWKLMRKCENSLWMQNTIKTQVKLSVSELLSVHWYGGRERFSVCHPLCMKCLLWLQLTSWLMGWRAHGVLSNLGYDKLFQVNRSTKMLFYFMTALKLDSPVWFCNHWTIEFRLHYKFPSLWRHGTWFHLKWCNLGSSMILLFFTKG